MKKFCVISPKCFENNFNRVWFETLEEALNHGGRLVGNSTKPTQVVVVEADKIVATERRFEFRDVEEGDFS